MLDTELECDAFVMKFFRCAWISFVLDFSQQCSYTVYLRR
jgi:hypothetical protein